MGVVPEERRTQALRGPGAGGFTPAQSVAASNPCLNCGTNVQLDYCPECGQHQIDPDPTLDEFAHEIAEEFLHWDGKLALTYRTLIAKPGELTNEFLAGRRVRYISPLRVYLACSVLFFFLNALLPAHTVIDRNGHRVAAGPIQVGTSTPQELHALDVEAAQPGLKGFWLRHMARAMRQPERLQAASTSGIPKAMFILVPAFAALIRLVYRDRRRRYPQHLAYALHVHAVFFLALAVMLLGGISSLGWARPVIQFGVALGFTVHVVLATRRVYGGSNAATIARLLAACGMYFVVFVGVLAAVFAITVVAS